MESIRLSALGRDVHVGDFYNYFNDNILPGSIRELRQNVEISSTCEVEHFFFFRLPHTYKRHVLGIHSHLDESIEGGSIDSTRLWFGGYLGRQSTQDENTAQVDVIFRIIRRIEALNQQHLDQQKMFEYQVTTGGKATHLVYKVVYGAELIISMKRALNLKFETKTNAEGDIYLAAKAYFETIGPKMNIGERPAEFKTIGCTIFSSIDPGNIKKGTFEDSCKLLRDLLNFKGSIYSFNEENWKPIEINLKTKFEKNLSAQIQARISLEKTNDVEFEIERNLAMLKAIIKESNVISKHPSINRIPPLEKAMFQFLDLLAKILKKIENFYSKLFVKLWSPEQIEKILSGMKSISDLLTDTTDWFIHRRKEFEIMCSILSDTKLSMSDLEEIKNNVSSGKEKRTSVFILKMDLTEDPLIDRLVKFIGNQEPFEFPVFWIATSGKHRIEHVVQLLKTFDNLNTKRSSLHCISHQIGLVPISSSMKDGTRITLGCCMKDLPAVVNATELPDRSIHPSENSEEDQLPISSPENSILFGHVETSNAQESSFYVYSDSSYVYSESQVENSSGGEELRRNETINIPRKQKTLFDLLSQCFSCFRCSKQI